MNIPQAGAPVPGPEDIYTGLVNSPLSSLLEEAVTIGIFVVSYAYVRRVAQDASILKKSLFWQRLILLGSVVLFVMFIAAAYEVDITPQAEIDKLRNKISSNTVESAQWMTIWMVPIDLFGIALMAALFLALSVDELPAPGRNTAGAELTVDLQLQLKLLFFFTGVWHCAMIAWWKVYSFYTEDVPWWLLGSFEFTRHQGFDVLFHVVFAGAHLYCWYFWHSAAGVRWRTSSPRLAGWLGVAFYTALVMTVYISRLHYYVGKFATSGTDVSAPGRTGLSLLAPGILLVTILVLRIKNRREVL